jgi:cytochrome c biogenesis protein CcmG/thiol:disulfide interchange protein DsbE|tara:strand:+ start:781 stop:1296 length:516 start_codon:yes stop_codon:yes gene_type:complete
MQSIIKIIIFGIIIFIIGVFFISLNKNSDYDTQNQIGKKISNINLEHFNEKKFYKDKDLKKNNYTLINFWASWCGPCRIEHPILMRLSNQKNLKLLGVNFKDKKDQANSFLKDFGNPYDILTQDTLGKQSVTFGIYGIPESILVDKNLLILKKFVGPLSVKDFNIIIKIIN